MHAEVLAGAKFSLEQWKPMASHLQAFQSLGTACEVSSITMPMYGGVTIPPDGPVLGPFRFKVPRFLFFFFFFPWL
jgi:hypothetical protein